MKRKNFTIILIMLTLIFASNTNPSWAADGHEEYIKVCLKSGSTEDDSYSLISNEGFVLCSIQDGFLMEDMVLPDYTALEVVKMDDQIVLMDNEGNFVMEDLLESTVIMPLDYHNEGLITFENTPYRGGIIIIPNQNGSLSALNYITMEHYLYGVLNAEIHHTHPEEALKAQAVAARSFAKLNMGKHRAEGFDVCCTTHCQVYRGYTGEYEKTNKAVDDTFGEVIAYNGRPVAAYYFKNSGGHTQDVGDVWSYNEPYLIGIEDEHSPVYPWNVSLTYETIKSRLESGGYYPGNVESVTIKERNKNGHVSNLEISGTQSVVNLTKEKIRNVLGATVVKSLNFTLEGGQGGVQGQERQKIVVSNGPRSSILNNETYIICSSGNVTKRLTTDLYASNGSGLVKLIEDDGQNVSSSNGVTFKGYGYGHGVGMPQDSAIEMAKLGFSYLDILKKYYTDIEIIKM